MLSIMQGDFFGVQTDGIGVGIRFFERIWSSDNKAIYNHSGLILDSKGTTLEALWKVKSQNLYDAYEGSQIIIARFTGDGFRTADDALKMIKDEYSNKWYPVWRIPLHMIPCFAKLNYFGLAVCSELAAKYAWLRGARHEQWPGTNPDTLADEWKHWKTYQIIFEGILSYD